MKKLAALLCIMFLVPLCQAQVRAYYSPEELDRNNGIFEIDTTSREIVIEARAAMLANKERQGRSRDSWMIAWNYRDQYHYHYVRVQSRNTDFGHLTDQRVLDIQYGIVCDDVDMTVEHVSVKKGVDSYNGYNSLALEWGDGRLSIFIGAKRLEKVMELQSPLPESPQCRIMSVGGLRVQSLVVECPENYEAQLSTRFTDEGISARIANSSDPLEGIWYYLDRDTDDDRARAGGRYIFYIVKDGDDYLMLYESGAVVNASRWLPLMIKGRLRPTRFSGHYDLIWYDSMMVPMDDDTYASVDIVTGILTVEFPIYRSRMRFYRGTQAIP